MKASLTGLTLGTVTLTPAFDPATLEYTATTTNATNTITATAAEGVTAAITVNDEAHTSGTAATWEEGENAVEITCTGTGMDTQVYTVTVTKETPENPGE